MRYLIGEIPISLRNRRYSLDSLSSKLGKAGRDIRFGPFGRYMEMMEDFAQIVRKEHANPYTYEYELMVQRTLLKACDHWKEDAV